MENATDQKTEKTARQVIEEKLEALKKEREQLIANLQRSEGAIYISEQYLKDID